MKKAMLTCLGLSLLVVGCAHVHDGYGDSYSSNNSSFDYGSSYFDNNARKHRDCLEKTTRSYERKGYNSDDAWAKAVRHCERKD
jgi:hypothetical protein